MTTIHKEVAAPRALTTFKAPPGTGFSEPSTFTLVRADSPAMCVMTDFKQVSVATINPDATLAAANQTMISRGVRLLLVVNRDDEVTRTDHFARHQRRKADPDGAGAWRKIQ